MGAFRAVQARFCYIFPTRYLPTSCEKTTRANLLEPPPVRLCTGGVVHSGGFIFKLYYDTTMRFLSRPAMLTRKARMFFLFVHHILYTWSKSRRKHLYMTNDGPFLIRLFWNDGCAI